MSRSTPNRQVLRSSTKKTKTSSKHKPLKPNSNQQVKHKCDQRRRSIGQNSESSGCVARIQRCSQDQSLENIPRVIENDSETRKVETRSVRGPKKRANDEINKQQAAKEKKNGFSSGTSKDKDEQQEETNSKETNSIKAENHNGKTKDEDSISTLSSHTEPNSKTSGPVCETTTHNNIRNKRRKQQDEGFQGKQTSPRHSRKAAISSITEPPVPGKRKAIGVNKTTPKCNAKGAQKSRNPPPKAASSSLTVRVNLPETSNGITMKIQHGDVQITQSKPSTGKNTNRGAKGTIHKCTRGTKVQQTKTKEIPTKACKTIAKFSMRENTRSSRTRIRHYNTPVSPTSSEPVNVEDNCVERTVNGCFELKQGPERHLEKSRTAILPKAKPRKNKKQVLKVGDFCIHKSPDKRRDYYKQIGRVVKVLGKRVQVYFDQTEYESTFQTQKMMLVEDPKTYWQSIAFVGKKGTAERRSDSTNDFSGSTEAVTMGDFEDQTVATSSVNPAAKVEDYCRVRTNDYRIRGYNQIGRVVMQHPEDEERFRIKFQSGYAAYYKKKNVVPINCPTNFEIPLDVKQEEVVESLWVKPNGNVTHDFLVCPQTFRYIPRKIICHNQFKLTLTVQKSEIPNAGFGLFLACTPENEKVKAKKLVIPLGQKLDIGVYGPMDTTQVKPEHLNLFKNFIFNWTIQGWSFDASANDQRNHLHYIDITDDFTGELCEEAQKNPLVYVNETIRDNEIPTVSANHDPATGKLHYFLGHDKPHHGNFKILADGKERELKIKYGPLYEEQRYRCGYSTATGEEREALKSTVDESDAYALREIAGFDFNKNIELVNYMGGFLLYDREKLNLDTRCRLFIAAMVIHHSLKNKILNPRQEKLKAMKGLVKAFWKEADDFLNEISKNTLYQDTLKELGLFPVTRDNLDTWLERSHEL